MDDLAKALAYQVKREIAERYFGVRKAIEEDRSVLDGQLDDLAAFHEQKIGPDLLRIYSVLVFPELIKRFLDAVGWKGMPYYDDYVVHSRTIRDRLFAGMEERGWTAFHRFRNRLFESYEKLYGDVIAYRDMVEEARDQAALVKEEIARFSGEFSLDDIIAFVKDLERREDLESVLGGNLSGGAISGLEERLGLEPVQDIEARIPPVPDLPSPESIKGLMNELAEAAYAGSRREKEGG